MPEATLATRPAHDAGYVRAAFQPGSWNADSRTVDVVWTTGAPVMRRDWMTADPYQELLDVSPEACDLARLNAGAPVLDTHSSYELCSVIGVVERASIANGQGLATIRLSDREEVAGICRDVANGIIRNISVGYRVDRWDIQKATADACEKRTAVAWTPYELSLVPIPADAGAQTRAAPAPEPAPIPSTPAATAAPEEPVMDQNQSETRAAPSASPIDPAAIIAVERQRMADLAVIARQAGLGAERVEKWFADGTTVDQARAAALEDVAAKREALAPVPTASVAMIRDERDTLVARMTDALTARRMQNDAALSSLPEATPAEHAREFMDLGLHGMIREIAIRSGVRDAHRWSGMRLADWALSYRDGSAISSSDFSAILTNSTNKFLRASYGAFPATWRGWTQEYDVADFKTITSAGIGNFPEPQSFPEGAPVPAYQLPDEGETFAVAERGRLVQLSRIAIVNDDLRAIDRSIRSAALGGYTALRRAVFGALTDNANMADGTALFATGHSNLGTAGTMTSTTVAELIKLLDEQTGVDGQPLPPSMSSALLVAPSKRRTALELTTSLIVPTASGNALPMAFRDMIEVVVDPFLKTGNDPYYLVRKDVPLIDIAYLAGDGRVPVVSSETEIEYTGITWRIMFNFGVKATNWRSGAANLG